MFPRVFTRRCINDSTIQCLNRGSFKIDGLTRLAIVCPPPQDKSLKKVKVKQCHRNESKLRIN